MASFTITMVDAQALRVVADVAKIRGVDISAMNTAQKVAFMKSDLQSYWQDCAVQVEIPAAGEAAAAPARAATLADIKANIIVT